MAFGALVIIAAAASASNKPSTRTANTGAAGSYRVPVSGSVIGPSQIDRPAVIRSSSPQRRIIRPSQLGSEHARCSR